MRIIFFYYVTDNVKRIKLNNANSSSENFNIFNSLKTSKNSYVKLIIFRSFIFLNTLLKKTCFLQTFAIFLTGWS